MASKLDEGMRDALTEYFNAKHTKHPSGCWFWMGGPGETYAQACMSPYHAPAHHLSFQLFKGPIPEGLEVDHTCNQKRCVNPDHLDAVTHAENIRRSKALTMPTRMYKLRRAA